MVDKAPVAYVVTVTQEYKVTVYYQEGLVFDNPDEIYDIVEEDAIDLAFNEDGLHVRRHDDSETQNGFIALVETFDPSVEILYAVQHMPAEIQAELNQRFTQEQQKEIMYGES